MGGERDRQRSEPSFSEEGIDSIAGGETPAEVDLDQLLNEIGKSISSKPASQSHDEGENETSTFSPADAPIDESGDEIDDEPPMVGQPEQSALDFGEVEQSYAGERLEPLPDSTDDNMNGEEPMSRGVLMAGGAVVALSLLCGAVGLFVALSASGKIEALQQSVDGLQTKLATMQVSGDPRVGQLQAEQAGLTSRIEELTTKVDGLATSPAKGGDSQVAELRKRLDALERKTPQTVKTVSTPSVAAATTKTATTKPAPSLGDWTVILVSYPTSAQADSERARLQKLGIRAEVLKSLVDGKPWFRVRVPGYASQESAKAAISGLESKSGIKGAWTAHR